MRASTSQMVTAMSSIMTVSTGNSTFNWKLKRILEMAFIDLQFRQTGDAEGEVRLHLALFRHDDLPALRGQPLVPGFQMVSARRDVFDRINVLAVGAGEIRIFQNQHHAAH